MKFLVLSLVAACFSFSVNCQNLIGMNEKEIKTYMRENSRNHILQDDKNSIYNYLKYSGNNDTETILFFLSDNSVCKAVRIICELNNKEQKINELDTAYGKPEGGIWKEIKDDKTYLIELKDEKWFFSININTSE